MEDPPSSWHILTDDAITYIAAICGSKARNRLMRVSKSLSYLASKKNMQILHCNPLNISAKDTIYYFIIGSLKNDFTLLENLVTNIINSSANIFSTEEVSSFTKLTTQTIIQNLLSKYHVGIISLSDASPDYILAAYAIEKPSSNFLTVYNDDYIKGHCPSIYTDYSDLLLAATHDQCEDVVKYLLTYGTIQINKKNAKGNNALHIATIHGFTNIIKLLLTHPDINIHERTNAHNLTALHIAAGRGNLDIIKLLLTYDETQLDQEANYAFNHRFKVLHIVARKGHTFCVKYLIACPNVNVNAQTNYRCTALHIAANEGHIDVINALLTRPDIDVNVKDHQGETALQLAQRRWKADNPALYQEIKDLLLLASAQ